MNLIAYAEAKRLYSPAFGRIIAYAIFDGFTPTADGPPASLAAPTVGASS